MVSDRPLPPASDPTTKCWPNYGQIKWKLQITLEDIFVNVSNTPRVNLYRNKGPIQKEKDQYTTNFLFLHF